ncbi:YusW family protein [Bacillus sp. B190/17]|uniref:YusW family protein n=1 Tax=Bacillus lumedeiriae TaxID=3058829 RepID=A0ABW8ICJ4_9BACI
MGYKTVISSLLIIGMLQGCNANDKDHVSSPPKNAPVEKENNTANQKNAGRNKEDLFNFTSFDLDVDYNNKQSYDVDYENEPEAMDAKIEDTVTNNTLRGNEAFDQLKPIFEKLTFDKETPDDQVIDEVLKAFSLKTDYNKFELAVEFTDGTKKEYEKIVQ